MTRWRDELGPLGYRSPVLVIELLARVVPVEPSEIFTLGEMLERSVLLEIDPRGAAWLDVVSAADAAVAGAWSWSTVESTLRDLVKVGAVYVTGKPGNSRRPDGRRVHLSVLGSAWLAGEVVAGPVEASADGEEPGPGSSVA